ncbi:MAG: HEPN domain-containing protein [Candidatus Omnitrophica bacterium]|nr:HEPN domain-containing protein [Candidatus Omnitrophota bacterium]
MKQVFKEYLEKKKIFNFPQAKVLVKKELNTALDDLNEAKDRFKNKKYKYATINAYYATFHAARALLYSKGYRERSHYALTIAIETLFVETGILGKRFIRILRDGMSLREDADYRGDFSKEGASLSISNATEFIDKAKELLAKTTTSNSSNT